MSPNALKATDVPVNSLQGSHDAPQVQRYVLLLLENCGDPNGRAGIFNLDRAHEISKMVANLGLPPTHLALDVILSSPGGDPHAAYKLAKSLRSRSCEVRFWVIEYAKSAATLLALCGDKLMMAVEAELGPLDIQMELSSQEGKGVMSAIDAIQPINYFGSVAENMTFKMANELMTRYQLSRRDAIELALSHADNLLSPVIAKIDPVAVSEASRALDITRRYAEELLFYHHLKTNDEDAHKIASQIAFRLVHHFPDHGYVITRDVAKGIGLAVFAAEHDQMWPGVRAAYDRLNGMSGQAVQLLAEQAFLSGPGKV